MGKRIRWKPEVTIFRNGKNVSTRVIETKARHLVEQKKQQHEAVDLTLQYNVNTSTTLVLYKYLTKNISKHILCILDPISQK